jgi:hypothetical protein
MYPVVLSAPLEETGRSRLTVFFRALLIIPWAIWASIWAIALYVTVPISWLALLFTARYPESLYSFHSSFLRFLARAHAYGALLTDEFPPFNGSPHEGYPVRLAIAPAKDSYSRAKVLFRIILIIPVYILAYIMQLILMLVAIVAWFVLVFAGRLPEGLYKPIRAALSYVIKAYSYYMLLTEDYPPIWLKEDEEAPALGGPGTAGSGSPQAPPPAPAAPAAPSPPPATS